MRNIWKLILISKKMYKATDFFKALLYAGNTFNKKTFFFVEQGPIQHESWLRSNLDFH